LPIRRSSSRRGGSGQGLDCYKRAAHTPCNPPSAGACGPLAGGLPGIADAQQLLNHSAAQEYGSLSGGLVRDTPAQELGKWSR